MTGLEASLLALVAAGGLIGLGWIALHIMREGFNLVHAGGNPRNVSSAHEALWNVGKGAVLILGPAAIAGFLVATLKFS